MSVHLTEYHFHIVIPKPESSGFGFFASIFGAILNLALMSCGLPPVASLAISAGLTQGVAVGMEHGLERGVIAGFVAGVTGALTAGIGGELASTLVANGMAQMQVTYC